MGYVTSSGVTNIATGTGLTGGPITGTGTISLANTAVTPNTYTLATITVDQQGRITAASSGTAGGTGTVTSITAGTGITLSPSPIIGTGSVALTVPVAVSSGGTNATTVGAALDNVGGFTGATAGLVRRTGAGTYTLDTSSFVTGGPFLPLTGGSLSGPGNLTVGGTLAASGDIYGAGSLFLNGLQIYNNLGVLYVPTAPLTLAAGNLTLSAGQLTVPDGVYIRTPSSNLITYDALWAGGPSVVVGDLARRLTLYSGTTTAWSDLAINGNTYASGSLSVAGITYAGSATGPSDPVQMTVPAGGQARVSCTVTGVRHWTMGVRNSGEFSISDETGLRSPLNIDLSGNAFFSGSISTSQTLNATANVIVGGYLQVPDGQWIRTPTANLMVYDGGADRVICGDAARPFTLNSGSNYVNGDLTCGGMPYCWRPDWNTSSDSRMKTKVRKYKRGLSAILGLQPISYQYNGKGGMPTGVTLHGLDASKVEPVMPEMIGKRSVRLDPEDAEETEILTLDRNPLIYALVNAVRELTVRLEAVERSR